MRIWEGQLAWKDMMSIKGFSPGPHHPLWLQTLLGLSNNVSGSMWHLVSSWGAATQLGWDIHYCVISEQRPPTPCIQSIWERAFSLASSIKRSADSGQKAAEPWTKWNQSGSAEECPVRTFCGEKWGFKRNIQELFGWPTWQAMTHPAGWGNHINSAGFIPSSITSFLGAHSRDTFYFSKFFQLNEKSFLGQFRFWIRKKWGTTQIMEERNWHQCVRLLCILVPHFILTALQNTYDCYQKWGNWGLEELHVVLRSQWATEPGFRVPTGSVHALILMEGMGRQRWCLRSLY